MERLLTPLGPVGSGDWRRRRPTFVDLGVPFLELGSAFLGLVGAFLGGMLDGLEEVVALQFMGHARTGEQSARDCANNLEQISHLFGIWLSTKPSFPGMHVANPLRQHGQMRHGSFDIDTICH